MSVDPRRGRVAWAQLEAPGLLPVTYTKAGHGTSGTVGSGAEQTIHLRKAIVAWALFETPGSEEHFKYGYGRTGANGYATKASTRNKSGFGAVDGGSGGGSYGNGGYGDATYGEGAGRGIIGSGSRESVFAESGFGTVGTGHFLTMLEPIDTGRLADELGSERGRVGDTVAGVVLEDIEEVAA